LKAAELTAIRPPLDAADPPIAPLGHASADVPHREAEALFVSQTETLAPWTIVVSSDAAPEWVNGHSRLYHSLPSSKTHIPDTPTLTCPEQPHGPATEGELCFHRGNDARRLQVSDDAPDARVYILFVRVHRDLWMEGRFVGR